MKSIAVVTDFNGDASKQVEQNLRSVFENSIKIKRYFINELEETEIIEGDCILVMLENRINLIRKYLVNLDNVIVITRTVSSKNINKIKSIPEHSKVLVVNDYYETTLELTRLLYQLRINDLQYISMKDEKDANNYDYCITTAMMSRVPKNIPIVIDLGVRVLDTSTFLNVFSLLKINSEKIVLSLLKYVNTIVSSDIGMKNQFIELYQKNKQLLKIMEYTNDAFLIIDVDGFVKMSNENCMNLIGETILEGQNINIFFENDIYIKIIDEEFSNYLYVNKDRKLLISSNFINSYADDSYKIIKLTDITYVKELEQTISKKLKETGLVAKYNFEDILHSSLIMDKCINKAKIFAESDFTILITGESGTGKELFAQAIHNFSSRKSQPFVAVNCAALPSELLESELFGYEKGAFTGARSSGKVGLIEKANNGTLFLDEIGEFPLESQSKLLRVIQEKQVMKIGGFKVSEVNIRIICATNKNLYEEVENRRFREDLFYRINPLILEIPPLRDRKEDILRIFNKFLNDENIDNSISNLLVEHNWKGNVRELRNVAEYYNVMRKTDEPLPKLFSNKEQKDIDTVDKMILSIIYNEKNIGRTKLINILSKREDVSISGYEIRKRLDRLLYEQFINRDRGKNGCSILEKGINVLDN